MAKGKVLVTGGAGYIGSHCLIKLIKNDYEPIVYDDFSNSSKEVFERIERLTGRRPEFYEGDVRDSDSLEKVFRENQIESVIHFAGKKSVLESEKEPLLYFSVNVGGTISLLKTMQKFAVKNFVFSSTATVYGQGDVKCYDEKMPLMPINNYGKSKLMCEHILQSQAKVDKEFNCVILRYFNPVGAHDSGLIGEDPRGIPANLMPYITMVAAGRLDKLRIFGSDYKTRDGTGARDYIHVEDLAEAHISALNYLTKNRGIDIFNIGTGNDTTVLELINAFERTNNIQIPFVFTDRREGDSDSCYACPQKANQLLGWKASKTLEDMCRDAWRWQKMNPNGLTSGKTEIGKV